MSTTTYPPRTVSLAAKRDNYSRTQISDVTYSFKIAANKTGHRARTIKQTPSDTSSSSEENNDQEEYEEEEEDEEKSFSNYRDQTNTMTEQKRKRNTNVYEHVHDHGRDSTEDDESDNQEQTEEESSDDEGAAAKGANGNETEEDDDDDEDDEDDDDDGDDEDTDSDSKAFSTRKYRLTDFEIIKTVGTGTFGRVCLCRDNATQRYVAMKILAMADVIRLRQTEHVIYERNILSEIKHPFMINLEWSTKDENCLYMIFEYVSGGELFSCLRNAGKFKSSTANYYTAEIVLALEYLHSLHIVYRDLKPENLLLNRHGHIKITDFGFAKKLHDRTWTLCGTPEYLAPEIIQNKGHNKAVDWWALGILIYEMLSGFPPFYDENPFGIYEKILGGKIDWPRHMDPIAKDLIKKLLTSDRTKRLGNMKNGAADVKRHRWFNHLNWDDVYNMKHTPPIVPVVKFDGDTSNFDDYPDRDWKPTKLQDQKHIELFNDF